MDWWMGEWVMGWRVDGWVDGRVVDWMDGLMGDGKIGKWRGKYGGGCLSEWMYRYRDEYSRVIEGNRRE